MKHQDLWQPRHCLSRRHTKSALRSGRQFSRYGLMQSTTRVHAFSIRLSSGPIPSSGQPPFPAIRPSAVSDLTSPQHHHLNSPPLAVSAPDAPRLPSPRCSGVSTLPLPIRRPSRRLCSTSDSSRPASPRSLRFALVATSFLAPLKLSLSLVMSPAS